jgi:hypothetical protein
VAFESLQQWDIALAFRFGLFTLRLILGTKVFENLGTVFFRLGSTMPETKAALLPNQADQVTNRLIEWTAIKLAVLPLRQFRFKADRKPIEAEFAFDI